MTKFLYLFRGGHGVMDKLSNEEKQAHMQQWQTWMQGLAQEGKLVDGLPLGGEGKVVEKRGSVISDGPYAEGKEIVGGYLIVNAENLDGAVDISKGCPIFEYGGNIEVREILSM